MGAWGHLPFENDDALDWLAELETQGAVAVQHALERAIAGKGDVESSSRAVAAAAIVALSAGWTDEDVPNDAAEWAAEHADAARHLAPQALEALRTIRRANELSDLWFEDDAEEWTTSIATLEDAIGSLGNQA